MSYKDKIMKINELAEPGKANSLGNDRNKFISYHAHLSHLVEKTRMWFPTRSDTNQPVQSQKMVRGLKVCIELDEGLYYPFSENKGADQLRGYREADLRLWFRICKLLVFP